MKVLLINGSSHQHGCTDMALQVISKELLNQGIESEIIWIGIEPIMDCLGCGQCGKTGHCFKNDIVNVIGEKAKTADGFIFGSPTYYAHPSGRLLSVMDRLSTSYGKDLAFKPAAAIMSARRGGTVASFDVINKHFTINNMPVVASSYWNQVFGSEPDDVLKDIEGVNTMTNLAKNMAWILKLIEVGKKQGITHPEIIKVYTNFHH